MQDRGGLDAGINESKFWIPKFLDRIRVPAIINWISPRSHGVRILAVMSGGDDFSTLSDVANRMNWSVTLTPDCEHAADVARSRDFAAILLDRDLVANWKHAVSELARSAPHSAVIVISYINESLFWEEVTSKGAYDVLRKPFAFNNVCAVISRAVTYWQLR
jgi:DNA-binding NtrC family response regulator